MKYTIVLRRSASLMELLDDDGDLYIANADIDFPDMKTAIAAARVEVARPDAEDIEARHEGAVKVDYRKIANRDYYEVLAVFEGRPTILAMPDITFTEML